MDQRVTDRLARLRGRGGTYAALVAPAVGLLVLGLLTPTGACCRRREALVQVEADGESGES